MRLRCLLGALVLAAGGMVVRPAAAGVHSPLTFVNHRAPEELGFAHGAGETSIGVNPRTGAAMFLMLLHPVRVTWDDGAFPPVAQWTDVSHPFVSSATADPILWTDPRSGRTFVAQLFPPVFGSLMAYTDDDGRSWQLTQPPITAPSFDHQSVGGGPYRLVPGGEGPLYPGVVYYCAQSGVSFSECTRSDDGGLTWSPPVPMNVLRCGGLHGHIVVGGDGTVYVPHKSCGGRQGLMVSETDGLVWSARLVPGTEPSLSDPAVAVDGGGRLYFATESGGRAVVATSDDHGLTWSPLHDVGASLGVVGTVFPMAVAGDAGRAAVAFYGTTTAGDTQAATFSGDWHLYVSVTLDGGESWETVDLTPDDPVQRGCIWLQGGSNPCRNLLDFQGMTIDAQGRILVGYADGCTERLGCNGPGGTPATSRDSLGVIARQVAGPRLRAAFDPPGPDPLRAAAGGPYRAAVGDDVPLQASFAGGIPPYSLAWDLDGDGAFDDAFGAQVTFHAAAGGVVPVAVRVTAGDGQAVVASSVVRVTDPARERVERAWGFDGPGGCDPQGWTAGDNAPFPSWHLSAQRADTPPCAWSHGVDDLDRYLPGTDQVLDAPCVDLPPTLAAARLTFRLAGETIRFADPLTVEVGPCQGGPLRARLVVSGPQGDLAADPPVYVTQSVDLSDLIGQGPVRVRFRMHPGVDPRKPAGYRLDTVTLVVQ